MRRQLERGSVDNKMRVKLKMTLSFFLSVLIAVVVAESNPLKVTFSWHFATISLLPRSKTILKGV